MCLAKIKRQNIRKYLKIWNDQIKPIIEVKKTSYKKWLASKNLEDKTAHKAISKLYIADSNICEQHMQCTKTGNDCYISMATLSAFVSLFVDKKKDLNMPQCYNLYIQPIWLRTGYRISKLSDNTAVGSS